MNTSKYNNCAVTTEARLSSTGPCIHIILSRNKREYIS